ALAQRRVGLAVLGEVDELDLQALRLGLLLEESPVVLRGADDADLHRLAARGLVGRGVAGLGVVPAGRGARGQPEGEGGGGERRSGAQGAGTQGPVSGDAVHEGSSVSCQVLLRCRGLRRGARTLSGTCDGRRARFADGRTGSGRVAAGEAGYGG